MNDLLTKFERIRSSLAEHPAVVVAFSGGVDSSLVLWAAHEVVGARAVAITVISPFLTSYEQNQAREVARAIGVEQIELEVDLLSDADIARNDRDRCYRCKRSVLQAIRAKAEEMGIALVVDGSNADDVQAARPGKKAIMELGTRSPLAEAGLTKEEVRILARRFGLPSAEKPSSACLASRVPYGEELTKEKLERIGKAEDALRELGFSQLRVRQHGPLARIEVGPEELERALQWREEIVSRLQELGFIYITLDLKGFRSGSMDEILPPLKS